MGKMTILQNPTCLRMKSRMYKDMTNKRFGRLMVIGFHGISKHRTALWLCRCKCGNETIVEGNSLRRTTRSCGCIQKEKASRIFLKNIVDKRFGRLVVLKRKLPNDGQNNVRWECKCDCGNVVIVRSGSLNNDRTKSCGCLHKDKVRKAPYFHLFAM